MLVSNGGHAPGDKRVEEESTVAVLVVDALLKGLEHAGVARADLLQALGSHTALLGQSDARLPVHVLYRACALAIDKAEDAALGLNWVESLSVRTFSPMSHMLAHAGNLRKAFGLMSQYQRLFCDRSFCEVRERGRYAELHVLQGWTFDSDKVERLFSEITVAGFLLMVRDYGARDGAFDATFKYARPAYGREYARVLGPSVRFGQPFTGLIFQRALLDVRPPNSDDDIQGAMRAIADRRLLTTTPQAPYAMRVRAVVCEALPARTTMSRVARDLGISVRSLRRHLSDEGTSFRELECTALETFAKRLLRDERLTIQETAYAMGFSDATTFHRAFKQWTGQTPKAFRASH